MILGHIACDRSIDGTVSGLEAGSGQKHHVVSGRSILFHHSAPCGLESAITQSSPQENSSAARPQARSVQERADFNAAYALQGAATQEAAAIDFANRYPASALRRYLYSSAMLQYQRENNPVKMLAMGERVLALDPDNPLALVLTATALADSLGDRDRDRDKKVNAIKHNATRGIQAAEAGYSVEPFTRQRCNPWLTQRWELRN